MIFKSHRAEAKAARADVDASELFGFAQNVEDVMRKDVRRWGIRHARYRKIRKSYRALIHDQASLRHKQRCPIIPENGI